MKKIKSSSMGVGSEKIKKTLSSKLTDCCKYLCKCNDKEISHHGSRTS